MIIAVLIVSHSTWVYYSILPVGTSGIRNVTSASLPSSTDRLQEESHHARATANDVIMPALFIK
jgi:hypothetical protein